MKKLFLGTFFSRHELDIINQQHINVAIALAKTLRPIVTNRIDQFVHELFGRDVAKVQVRIAILDRVTAGMHQVSFA